MEGVIADGKEWMEEDAEPELMDAGLIGAAQHVEHYEIAGYGCVRTYAELLGERSLPTCSRKRWMRRRQPTKNSASLRRTSTCKQKKQLKLNQSNETEGPVFWKQKRRVFLRRLSANEIRAAAPTLVHNESIMTASSRQISPQPAAPSSEPADAIGDQPAQNQVPPLTGYNLFLSDRTLVQAVEREGAGWAREQITELGRLLGTEEAQRWGFEANENKPVLHTHDRFGNRRDEVVFHPSWHNLMRTSVANRLHCLPWESQLARTAGAHVARAALMMLTAQNEAGHTCPISMTFSAVAALRAEPELAAEWEPRILSSTYDPRFAPAQEKSGVLLGMGMTEKQGGSDVRANTTRAERIGSSREYPDHGT